MRKFLSYLIVFTIIFMITILSFIGCKKEAFPTEEATPTEEETTAEKTEIEISIEISEQPDGKAFKEYFSDIGLGKLPAGGEFPNDIQQNINIFSPDDQICLYGTIIKEVTISTAIFD